MDCIWEGLGLPGVGPLDKENTTEFSKYVVSIELSKEIYVYFYIQKSSSKQHKPDL